jgi:hypothetical protein
MKEYKTTDMYLAAYLKALGYNIVSVDRGNKFRFVFEDTEELRKKALEYYNGGGSVAPVAYNNQIRIIKSMTFSN